MRDPIPVQRYSTCIAPLPTRRPPIRFGSLPAAPTMRANNTLRLVSGSTGATSSVKVTAGAATDVAAPLQLIGTASHTIGGSMTRLTGGSEIVPPWDTPTTIGAYLGPTRADGLG